MVWRCDRVFSVKDAIAHLKLGLQVMDKVSKKEVNMKKNQQFTAIIEREGDGYVSLCPELDIASQGDTVEQAKNNLIEALELFFEVADPLEVQNRLRTEVFVTRVEVSVG
ncbi:type II toxin-antitoxin system HicB family antitoxin [Trichocoleus sp. DQ-A3]|uniref:type II toxin-antitoxin system HicB family antitoxin n=1 Tax=Coleofasciculus sp. FACHB-125 TaxID=2692784 RepID=UPI0030DA2152